MDAADFARIVNHRLLSAFPDLAEYVKSQSEATRKEWAADWEPFDADDLLAAILDARRGTIDLYHGRWNVLLLQRARLHRDERLAAERRAKERERLIEPIKAERSRKTQSLGGGLVERMESYGKGLGPALREVLRRMEEGEDRLTVVAEICERNGW